MSDTKHSGGRPRKIFSLVKLTLLKLQGQSLKEIARALGISKSTVARALKSESVVPAPTTEQEHLAEIAQVPVVPEAPIEIPPEVPVHPVQRLAALLAPGPEAKPAQPVVEPGTVGQVDDDERPVDWAEEERVDLPTRTPGRIRSLLQHESPEQTRQRLVNDKLRYFHQHGLPPFAVQ